MLYKKYKLGLMAAYFSCLFWAFTINRPLMFEALGGGHMSLVLAIVLGTFFSLLGLMYLFQPSR
ncbi:MAG: hypothetical protein ACE5ER_00705 [Nitrospinaceae bacterium]